MSRSDGKPKSDVQKKRKCAARVKLHVGQTFFFFVVVFLGLFVCLFFVCFLGCVCL